MFRATPRQSDLMIVAGTLTNKMAPALRKVYDQMVRPRAGRAQPSPMPRAAGAAMGHLHGLVRQRRRLLPVRARPPGLGRGVRLRARAARAATRTRWFAAATASCRWTSTCPAARRRRRCVRQSLSQAAPDCPLAQALMYGVMQLQKKIKRQKATQMWYRK